MTKTRFDERLFCLYLRSRQKSRLEQADQAAIRISHLSQSSHYSIILPFTHHIHNALQQQTQTVSINPLHHKLIKMCQLSSTAMICEQCRRLVIYSSVASFCLLGNLFEEEQHEEGLLEENTEYVSYLECRKCNPSRDGLAE